MLNKKLIYILGIITLFGFGTIGLLVIYFIYSQSFIEVFSHQHSFFFEFILGILYGFMSAYLGWQIIKLNFMEEVRKYYASFLKHLKLNTFEIIFLSICAGIGEELLFRGAIQPFLGIWITSVLFVAIHGYLNPLNWQLSIYGLYLTLVIAGIGYMVEEYGLLIAMSSHATIDMYLFFMLNRYAKKYIQNSVITDNG